MKAGCDSKTKTEKRSIELPVLQNAPAPKSEVAHSKMSRWRAGALIALTLLMIAHVIQWKISGSTISPIEPSESMYTLQNGAVNAGFIFFSLAILATLIFGRFVCGWGCHIVALQDFCAWLLGKMGLKPRPFRSRLLVFVPLIVALYMFVWPTVAKYFTKPANQPLFPQFTNHLITTNFWETFPPFYVAVPFLFICGFMTVYFLGQKGFCTYACPYGGFFGVADRIAPGKIRVTDACNECGHCTATCTSNVLVHSEVKQYGMVVDTGCMKCMDCITVCPNDALYYGFGKPSILVSKPEKRNFSLTWPEEIIAALVFAISFFAVWNVYQLVPMLMALGIATVTMYVVMRTSKLLTSKDLAFYGKSLRSNGKFTLAGLSFIGFAVLWTGLNLHSGWIRYNEREGGAAFANLQVPEELALARPQPDQWLSETDRVNMANAKRHLDAAEQTGLLVNGDAVSKSAWLTYLSGDTEKAVELLTKAIPYHSGRAGALSQYYRGTMLNRLGRYNEALVSLDQALIDRPELVLAREERGESLWQVGRRQEAINAWADAVEQNQNLPVATYFLAGAVVTIGKTDLAASFESQANRISPQDPHFHWMVGLRLQNVGMNELADKHFARARQLDVKFRDRPIPTR